MATSRSPRVTFITSLALIFVAIVTLGATDDTLRTNARSLSSRDLRAAWFGGCPVEKGYFLYNNRCLKLYINKEDYQTAKRRCETDGTHLFYFKSRELDGQALLLLMDAMGQQLLVIGHGLWVGANDIVTEGRFLWSDGSVLPRDSGLWSSGQPDDNWASEDCVEVGYMNAIVLNDFPCTKTLGFVCQADIKMQ